MFFFWYAMQAIRIESFGGPERLVLRELPDPAIGPGQVRIAVRAAGVNFADLMMRMGLYPEAPPRPFTPGYEVAGTVAEIGPGVTRVRVGDRVIAGTRFGGYATMAVSSEDKVLTLPDELSFAEGAAIPVNYLTAWIALHGMARIGRGERVLIHNAAGGVGLAAVQLARRLDCEIFGTAGSPEKLAYLAEHGVAHPIAYRTTDFAAEVLRITAERGVDLILDPIGGETTRRGFRVLTAGGRMVLYGVSTMVEGRTRNLFKVLWEMVTQPRFSAVRLLNANRGVFGLNVLKLWDDDGVLNTALAGIVAGVKEGWLRPRVHQTFPLREAGRAHESLQDRKNIGKIVLVVEP